MQRLLRARNHFSSASLRQIDWSTPVHIKGPLRPDIQDLPLRPQISTICCIQSLKSNICKASENVRGRIWPTINGHLTYVRQSRPVALEVAIKLTPPRPFNLGPTLVKVKAPSSAPLSEAINQFITSNGWHLSESRCAYHAKHAKEHTI